MGPAHYRRYTITFTFLYLFFFPVNISRNNFRSRN